MPDPAYPTPHTVAHTTPGAKIGENPAGQPKFGPPVTQPVAVYGWQPASEQELRVAQLAGRNITELVLLTPDGDWPADSGVTLPDGREFEVDGPVRDYNTGPFGFFPGFAVDLRRVNDGAS